MGCSTGSLLKEINKRHLKKDIELIGFDQSKEMISKAKNKNKNKNTKFINKDLESIKLKKSDLIISLYTIQFSTSI